MLKILALLAFLGLSGCATIQNHPYATGFAVAIVAGSIVASAHHDNQGGGPATANANAPSCLNGGCR